MSEQEEYEEYGYDESDDTHAKSRDSKMKHRSIDKMMRGNRSVFTIKEARQKRDKHLRDSIRHMGGSA